MLTQIYVTICDQKAIIGKKNISFMYATHIALPRQKRN